MMADVHFYLGGRRRGDSSHIFLLRHFLFIPNQNMTDLVAALSLETMGR